MTHFPCSNCPARDTHNATHHRTAIVFGMEQDARCPRDFVKAYFTLDCDVRFALCRDQGRGKVFFRKIVIIDVSVTKNPKTTSACGVRFVQNVTQAGCNAISTDC
jgi:hypothetical protein